LSVKLVDNQGYIEPSLQPSTSYDPYGVGLDSATTAAVPGLPFSYGIISFVGGNLSFSYNILTAISLAYSYHIAITTEDLSSCYTIATLRPRDVEFLYNITVQYGDLAFCYDSRVHVYDDLLNFFTLRSLVYTDHTISYAGQWASVYISVELVSRFEIQPFVDFRTPYHLFNLLPLSFDYSYHVYSLRERELAYSYETFAGKSLVFIYTVFVDANLPFTFNINVFKDLLYTYHEQPFADLPELYDVNPYQSLSFSYLIFLKQDLRALYTIHPYLDLLELYDVNPYRDLVYGFVIRASSNLTSSYYIHPFAALESAFTIHPFKDFPYYYCVNVDKSIGFSFTIHPFGNLYFEYHSFAFRTIDFAMPYEIKASRDLKIRWWIQPYRDLRFVYHSWVLVSTDLPFSFKENYRHSDLYYTYETRVKLDLPFSYDSRISVFTTRVTFWHLPLTQAKPIIYSVNYYVELLYSYDTHFRRLLPFSYSLTRGSRLPFYSDLRNFVSVDFEHSYKVGPVQDLLFVFGLAWGVGEDLGYNYNLNRSKDLVPVWGIHALVDFPFDYKIGWLVGTSLKFGYNHAYTDLVAAAVDYYTNNYLSPYHPSRLRYEYAEVAYATQKPSTLRLIWHNSVYIERIDFRLYRPEGYPAPKHFVIEVSDTPYDEDSYTTVVEVFHRVTKDHMLAYDAVSDQTNIRYTHLRMQYSVGHEIHYWRDIGDKFTYTFSSIYSGKGVRIRILDDTSVFTHFVSYPSAFNHFYTLALYGYSNISKELVPPYHILHDGVGFLTFSYGIRLIAALPFSQELRVAATKDLTYSFDYIQNIRASLQHSYVIGLIELKELKQYYNITLQTVSRGFLVRFKTKGVVNIELSCRYNVWLTGETEALGGRVENVAARLVYGYDETIPIRVDSRGRLIANKEDETILLGGKHLGSVSSIVSYLNRLRASIVDYRGKVLRSVPEINFVTPATVTVNVTAAVSDTQQQFEELLYKGQLSVQGIVASGGKCKFEIYTAKTSTRPLTAEEHAELQQSYENGEISFEEFQERITAGVVEYTLEEKLIEGTILRGRGLKLTEVFGILFEVTDGLVLRVLYNGEVSTATFTLWGFVR